MAEEKFFQSALALLKPAPDETARFPLHWLSDLDSSQTRRLEKAWHALAENSRRDLIGRMGEEARQNFELDFSAAARVALRDSDSEVRGFAIRALSDSEDRRVADPLLGLLQEDPDFLVRAEAALALGRYMEWAELGEVSAALGARVERALQSVWKGGDHLEVRRRALESIGYSSTEGIREYLLEAYRHREEAVRTSAVTAMGHSLDSDWEPQIRDALESGLPGMRAEAARAAGEIAIRSAVPVLIELLSDSEPAVRHNAIWALGELGGAQARRALEELSDHAGADDEEFVAEAMENLDFEASISGDQPLFDLEDDELDEEEDEESEPDEDEETE